MSRFFHRTPNGKLAMSRRTALRGLLGGAAAVVALPTLEAMLNSSGTALADGGAIPRRLVTWFFGNGVRLNRWVPQGYGANYPLSDALLPLANVKEYVSVLSGFDNFGAVVQFGHYEGMAILSGHPMTNSNAGYPKPGGPTIDQVVAAAVGSKTTFPSIELGVSKRVDTYSGPLLQYAAHKGVDLPLPPEYNPQAVFNKLFGSFTPGNDPKGPLRASVLDAVRQDALDIQKRVGTADRQRLEAHLESIGTLQKQIAALPPVCTLPDPTLETNIDVSGAEPLAEVNQAMSSLMAYALACDITRAGSIMFTSAIGTTIFNTVTPMEHHNLTHSENQELVHQGVVFTMQCFAALLEQLKAMPEGTGNLLDNTVVICSSDCSEGATHETVDQPLLVAGGGGGALKTPGVHYRASGKENTADVLLACLQAVVPDAVDIGSGQGYSNKPCKAIKVG
jgi:hypothetical protein